MMSTPSLTAWSIAATESDSVQPLETSPPTQQTWQAEVGRRVPVDAAQGAVDRGRAGRVDGLRRELLVGPHVRDLRGLAESGGVFGRQLGGEAGQGDVVGVVDGGRGAGHVGERGAL